jgi:hypothetical protein
MFEKTLISLELTVRIYNMNSTTLVFHHMSMCHTCVYLFIYLSNYYLYIYLFISIYPLITHMIDLKKMIKNIYLLYPI